MTDAFFTAYLNAWVFWLCLSLGCFGLLVLHHVLKAQWGRAVLPVLEAGAAILPLMFVLYLPVLFAGMPVLYPWASGEAHGHIAEHRAPYLNMPFFIVRLMGFFAVWWLFTWLLTRSRRTRGDAPEAVQFRTNLAAPGLVVFVLTVTFAMTDWVMALEEHWGSTIYGVWFITGQALSALALVTVWYARSPEPHPKILKDLGNLLLAFTLFWAYISLSQYLIIWSANLPEEATYYLRRSEQGWDVLGGVLMVGHFLVPFLALLSGKTKRSPRLLSVVAGWLLVMRVVDVYWIVVPSARQGSAVPTLMEVVLFFVIGVLWLGMMGLGLRAASGARVTVEGSAAHA